MSIWPGSEETDDGEFLDLAKGRGPWQPWHYIGLYSVSPGQVRPGLLEQMKIKDRMKRHVIQQIESVLISSRAINKMMGKPENDGFEG